MKRWIMALLAALLAAGLCGCEISTVVPPLPGEAHCDAEGRGIVQSRF